MVVRNVAAAWKPRAEEPLQCAEFQVDAAADLNLCNGHRWKPEPADLTHRRESLRFDGSVIAAVLKRNEFGILPLVAKPLAFRDPVPLGPGHEPPNGLDNSI